MRSGMGMGKIGWRDMHYLAEVGFASYVSNSQKIRVLSERWLQKSGYCPSCGNVLSTAPNNSRACDFFCSVCHEEFELKSKHGKADVKVLGGAYETLISRVKSANNPNLYLLSYNKVDYLIENLLVVPRYFFTPSIIEKRKPLTKNARRAGWVGCNILVRKIPDFGKIHYIRNKEDIPKEKVLEAWHDTVFLQKETSEEGKGWLLDTIQCIESMGVRTFSLDMIYRFESDLRAKYPNNRHIRDKLRQQLQLLRDKGYLEFLSKGMYRVKR